MGDGVSFLKGWPGFGQLERQDEGFAGTNDMSRNLELREQKRRGVMTGQS
jgi:hypothetical protein